MKNLYMLILVAVLAGCNAKEKIVQQQQENLLMAAVTTGQWKVTSFTANGTNITNDFSAYSFQFKTNYTVDAINSGNVEKTGNWNAAGNAQAQTITASFGNVSNPLLWINGVWNINNTTWTSVEATQTTGSEVRTMRLDKL